MEKKTIGSFIAALRKSSGMTQKELAQMLNVSDKTISHWERDESAPDLSLIPVIAEIFEITCDELLRGEKNSKDTPQSEKVITPRGKKQLKFLLEKNLNRLKISSLFCIAISIVGFIAGIICNYSLERIKVGFFVSSAFSAISFVLLAVNYIMYIFSLKNMNEISEEIKKEYTCKGNAVTARIIYFCILILCFSIGLAGNQYLEDVISCGALYAGGALASCIIIDIILKSLGIIYKKERSREEKKLFNFSIIIFAALAVIMIGTGIFQYIAMTRTAELGDIMSMLRYLLYPIEVIIAFIVYAAGVKIIKKPRN